VPLPPALTERTHSNSETAPHPAVRTAVDREARAKRIALALFVVIVAGTIASESETITLGVHNGTVAITIGAGIATILASPAAVYSVFMFITAGLFARLMYRRNSEIPVRADGPAATVAAGPAASTSSEGALWKALGGLAIALAAASVLVAVLGLVGQDF